MSEPKCLMEFWCSELCLSLAGVPCALLSGGQVRKVPETLGHVLLCAELLQCEQGGTTVRKSHLAAFSTHQIKHFLVCMDRLLRKVIKHTCSKCVLSSDPSWQVPAMVLRLTPWLSLE